MELRCWGNPTTTLLKPIVNLSAADLAVTKSRHHRIGVDSKLQPARMTLTFDLTVRK